MSNSKISKAIFSWLIIFSIILLVSGCARWPDGPGPEPGEIDYQLKITVEVKGEINTNEGIYYIVLDTNENSADGPGDDISLWEDNYYYIKLENGLFHFAQKEEGSPEIDLVDSLSIGNKLEVTIALKDLGNPSSVDINVLTTDLENITYDSLDNGYFTINTKTLGSIPDILEDPVDSQDGADFDLVKVTAEITIY